MSSHKIEYPKYIRITYTLPSYRGGVFTIWKDFKTANNAAKWYAQQWTNKRFSHLPYNPHDGRQAIVERRVKKIFKKYLP